MTICNASWFSALKLNEFDFYSAIPWTNLIG